MAAKKRNPYVGPRSFTRDEGDLFFGRDDEARDLLSLVIAERLVLFYAPSGAGKSSLLNARLAPGLAREGFFVLPTGRVSGELPPGVEHVDNVFAFNLMLSLEQNPDLDPNTLAHLTLSQFLEYLTTTDGQHYAYVAPEPAGQAAAKVAAQPPHVLIVDQFEEILTHHQDRWLDREAFFDQLNEAMGDDPMLWVVLAMREDHVAALDPYRPLLAERLRDRYHMPRMGTDAAMDAVRRPAETFGRPFAPGVAKALVDNLCQVRVHERPGTAGGQFVEPVQLQVVCYQLWEEVEKGEAKVITRQDLPLGFIDKALTTFYETAIQEAARTAKVSQKALRTWVQRELITQDGTRGNAYRGAEESEGIPTAAADALVDRFLLRTEHRAGGTWYELIHDRFVDPILNSNRRAQLDDLEYIRDWGGEEIATWIVSASDMLLRAVREVAAGLSDEVSLDVRTYEAVDNMDRSMVELRAATTVKLDGDMSAFLPLGDSGDVDGELWRIHQEIVEQALNYRFEFLHKLVQIAAWIENLLGEMR